LTVLVSLAAYFFISNYPLTTSWLSDEEKSYIHARLKADCDATHDEKFKWGDVWLAVEDPKCWLYGLAFHTLSLPLYTLSLFLVGETSGAILESGLTTVTQPTIIKAMGYTAAQSQLLTVPPYAIATILTVIWAVVSEKSGRRAPFIVASSGIGILGYIILLANPSPTKRPGVSYLGTFFAAAGIYPSTALALSWPANNVSGQTKRATANAMQISIGNLGAVLGTQLYRPNTSPKYVLGHSFALGYLAMNIVVICTLWYILAHENRKKRLYLEQNPSTGSFHDISEDGLKGDRHPRWRFNV
jgi:Sugar (and other) transporter